MKGSMFLKGLLTGTVAVFTLTLRAAETQGADTEAAKDALALITTSITWSR